MYNFLLTIDMYTRLIRNYGDQHSNNWLSFHCLKKYIHKRSRLGIIIYNHKGVTIYILNLAVNGLEMLKWNSLKWNKLLNINRCKRLSLNWRKTISTNISLWEYFVYTISGLVYRFPNLLPVVTGHFVVSRIRIV